MERLRRFLRMRDANSEESGDDAERQRGRIYPSIFERLSTIHAIVDKLEERTGVQTVVPEGKASPQDEIYYRLLSQTTPIIKAYVNAVFYISPLIDARTDKEIRQRLEEGDKSIYYEGQEFRERLYAQDLEIVIQRVEAIADEFEQSRNWGYLSNPDKLRRFASDIEQLLNTYTEHRRYLYEDEVGPYVPKRRRR